MFSHTELPLTPTPLVAYRRISSIVAVGRIDTQFVGRPGFEPGMTEPKSVVLPLHHHPLKSHRCGTCEL